MLACTVAPHFEGDQWTFCKPTATELAELYGRARRGADDLAVAPRARRGAARARTSRLVEVDAFHLPDTAGVSYRSAHQKTTIGIVGLDEAQRRLDYYHNAGRYRVARRGARRRAELARCSARISLPSRSSWTRSRARVRRGAICSGNVRERSPRDGSPARESRIPSPRGRRGPRTTRRDCAATRSGVLPRLGVRVGATGRRDGGAARDSGAIGSDGGAGIAAAAESLRTIARTLKAQQFRLARLPRGGRRRTSRRRSESARGSGARAQDGDRAAVRALRSQHQPVSLPARKQSAEQISWSGRCPALP